MTGTATIKAYVRIDDELPFLEAGAPKAYKYRSRDPTYTKPFATAGEDSISSPVS